MELAAELLEVTNEQELDHFLGDLIKKAGSAVGQFVSSPVGQAIGGVLKTAAKTALPIAGGALGAYVGGPLGARIGSGLASMAGQALGLELEGLSQEDREFQSARQFVRWAGDTAKNTLTAPRASRQLPAWQCRRRDAIKAAKAAAATAAARRMPPAFWAAALRPTLTAAAGFAVATTSSSSEFEQLKKERPCTTSIGRKWNSAETETFEFTAETGVFNENQELELAVELLEINSEAELDRFLGDLISKAGQAAGQFISSPTGQALGGLLKGAAKKVLPMAGQAIGGYFGGSTGAQIGGKLASAASNLFESEGMSGEDRELDAAKSFIRLAGDAVKNVGAAPAGSEPETGRNRRPHTSGTGPCAPVSSRRLPLRRPPP